MQDRLVLEALRDAFLARRARPWRCTTSSPPPPSTSTGDESEDAASATCVKATRSGWRGATPAAGSRRPRLPLHRHGVRDRRQREHIIDLSDRGLHGHLEVAARRQAQAVDPGRRQELGADGARRQDLRARAERGRHSKISVSRDTINAVSAAASLAIGVGGTAGVAVSGAGAVAQNVILTQDQCLRPGQRARQRRRRDGQRRQHVEDLVRGGGGLAGHRRRRRGGRGRLDRHLRGAQLHRLDPGRHRDAGRRCRPTCKNTSVAAGGDLTLTSLADQTINSVVFAGSVAVGRGRDGRRGRQRLGRLGREQDRR